MSLQTIKAFLVENGTVEEDPAEVSARNSDVWPTAADVADYAWKPLSEIWLLSGANSSAFLEDTIVYKKGESADNATQSISLLAMPEASYQNEDGLKNNEPGATDYYLEIIYKLPQGKVDFNKLYQTSLKVRYLLDHTWRARRGARPNYIRVVPAVDKSLGNGFTICTWQGYTFPPNGTVIVEQWLIRQEIIVPK